MSADASPAMECSTRLKILLMRKSNSLLIRRPKRVAVEVGVSEESRSSRRGNSQSGGSISPGFSLTDHWLKLARLLKPKVYFDLSCSRARERGSTLHYLALFSH